MPPLELVGYVSQLVDQPVDHLGGYHTASPNCLRGYILGSCFSSSLLAATVACEVFTGHDVRTSFVTWPHSVSV